MPDDLEFAETARRCRAAIAYADTSARFGRKGAATAIGVSVAMVDRFTGANRSAPLLPTWEQRQRLAIACGLPPAFFFADFDRLEELVPDGLPRFGATSPAAGDAPAPAPQGELGRRVAAPKTSGADREEPQTRPGPGARRGSGR